jgi:hypothetical protein
VATVALAVVSSFLAMLATLAVLVATSILDSAAGSRVDVGQVPRAEFRQPFYLEINPYPPSTSSKVVVPLTPELSIVTSETSANATSRSRDTYRTLS